MGAYAAAGVGAMELMNSYAQSQAMKRQGDYEMSMADINSKYSDMQAADAIERGDKASNNYRKKVNQTAGSQRASLAAQGIAVDSGSAADIVDQTREVGAQDAATIRANAFREALGFKQASFQSQFQGRNARNTGYANANNTLMGGGLRALSSGIQTYGASKDWMDGGSNLDNPRNRPRNTNSPY